MLKRPRRNRKSEVMRNLIQETRLTRDCLVYPLFVIEGAGKKEAINSLPLVNRLSIDNCLREVEGLNKKGVHSFLLFPCVLSAHKDDKGSYALSNEDVIPKAIKEIKKHFPSVNVITDIALDPYTSHGHDGVVNTRGEILNDETVSILSKMALVHAEAGADIVAPSDMMDGRVKAIRESLDNHNHSQVSILSYAAKYASSLYGPFREALGSGVKFGDKKTYQMNPANIREAVLEAQLDEEEGADLLLVKPASLYLDVIQKIKQESLLPVGAYHVSGEYAMVMAAAKEGMLNKEKVFLETLLSIKRAGADFICTYSIPQIIDLI